MQLNTNKFIMGYKKCLPLIFLAAFIIVAASGKKCQHPPPAENFTDQMYAGRWYEVGKIQTPGGAAFQEGTVCTIATYSPVSDPNNGGGDIGYSSRQDNPDGKFVNATGTLKALNPPGHFTQQLVFFGIPGLPVDYNVIHLDEDSAIEYDCHEIPLLGVFEYCVHFMSRTPEMTEEKLQKLRNFADGLGLNVNSVEYKTSSQEGCWP